MTTYVICLTSEEQEAVNATRWASAHNARQVAKSGSRSAEALRNTQAGDVVVIVAHGSATAIGTSHDSVTYTVETLTTLLVGTLAMQDGVRVVLAACDTDQFAVALEDKIHKQGLHMLAAM